MHTPARLILWGVGHVGSAVVRAVQQGTDLAIVGALVASERKHGKDVGRLAGVASIGVKATTSRDDILALAADVVIFAPAASVPADDAKADVIALLKSGKNVISTAALPWQADARADFLKACQQGQSTLHVTGLHPGFMVQRFVLTLARGLSAVDHIRFMEALDVSQAPAGLAGDLNALGFGEPVDAGDVAPATVALTDLRYSSLIAHVAEALYGAAPSQMHITRECQRLPARLDTKLGRRRIRAGSTGVVHITHKGYLGDHHFFTNEECWYLGADNAWHGDSLPYGNFSEALAYTVEMFGGSTRLSSQLEIEAHDGNPFVSLAVQAALDAIRPLRVASPGLLVSDASPRYQNDSRLAD